MLTTASSSPTPVTHRRPALVWPVISFATLAGMRSAGTPTLLSYYLVRHPAEALAASPLRLFQQPGVAAILTLAAAKEFKHDKDPSAPPRTAPRGLSFRVIGSALVGATWFKANKGNALHGALLGSLGAAASTFLWFHLRKSITEKSGLPPNAVGLGEDVLLWSVGAVLLHSMSRATEQRAG